MRTGAQPPAEPDSTFVGRKDHLDRLTHLRAQAASGRPVTLLVYGEAGVGKSRLLREFTDQARRSGSQVLSGSCIALGIGELPYAPLIDALRRLARGVGPDELLKIAGPGYRELAELVSDAAESAGEPAGGVGGQYRVFDAVMRMLDHLCTEQPVVFVMEDLQWSDSSTLDLFSYLTRTRTNERLLLIGSYRTTGLPPRHPLRIRVAELDGARLIQHMEVLRFTRSDLREFLRNTVDSPITHDLVERTFELTDGNALFLEEVIAAGVLTASGSDDGAVALPGTIRELLLPRYELLSDDAQRMMGVAATAGRRVSHRLLEAVCDLPQDRMLAALRECVASQLLVADPTDETYLFRHALVREVVHQALIPGDRLHLHRWIALALAGNSDLSYAEQLTVAAELSYHWYAAKEYPQALAAAVRAGHDALRLFAFREAGRQFDRALEVWQRLPDAAEIAGVPRHRLLCAAADAARWAGRIGRAVELADTAVSELDPMRQPALAGDVYERLGSYLWEAGDHRGAERAYTKAADLLEDAPPSAVAARVLAVHATAQVRKGHTADGLRLGRQALEMARSVGARAEEGRALNTIGVALGLRGQIAEGAAALREAIRIADSMNQLEDLFRAYGNLVFTLEHAGQPDKAVASAVEGLERARVTGLEHTRGRGVLANNLCAALFLLGRWDEATRIIEQILLDHQPAERLFPGLTLAEIAIARGQFDRAERLLAEVRESGAAVEQPQFVGAMYASIAEIAVWRGRTEAARAAVVEGLRAIADTDNLVVQLRLYALGLRIQADERLRHDALRATARYPEDPEEPTLASMVAAASDDSALPEVATLRRLCRAERDRATGSGQAQAWSDVASEWAGLKRPYWTAYARWRQAQAAAADSTATRRTRHTSERIAVPAREAYLLAAELGAEPLRREIEAFAASNRIELVAAIPGPRTPADDAPGTPVANSFGLTRREREVLAYVSVGWSNRRIAKTLFITEKTAGVHVSNILRKLEVPNRSSAAAKAQECHLLDSSTAG